MTSDSPSGVIPPASLPILRVRWQVQYTQCNLQCPYCIAAWTKRPVDFEPERFDRILARLLEMPYRLVLRIGVEGEFFLSREIQEGVVRLTRHPKVEGVSFSSNLVATRSKVEAFLDQVDTSRLGMGVTLHDTQIANVEEFFEKVELVQKRGVLVYVGYVGIPERFEKIAEYKHRLESLGVPFILNEYNGVIQKVPFPRAYTQEQREFLREHFFSEHYYEMLVERRSPKGKRCLAGHRYLYLSGDGTAYACGVDKNPAWTLAQKALWRLSPARAEAVQAHRRERNRLGNILTDDIKLSGSPRLCPHSECTCGNEVQAMASVDRDYLRTRTLRIIYPKARAGEYEARYPNLKAIE